MAVPTATPDRIPLSVLRPGERAVVELTGLSADEAALLKAMGLSDRAEVRICRSGSPCIIEVAHTRLGLAASVACRIFTTPCGASCPAAVDAGGRTAE
ncbi:MAG: FeoA family protein [Phycisphaerales bacterium]